MYKLVFSSFVISILLITLSCNNNQSAIKQFTKLTTKQTGIDFINQVEGTKDFNVFTYRNFFNGGGVAIGDVNNDSLPDIYFTSNQHQNKLYLNKGNFTFEDVTTKAGVGGTKAWSTGVSMVDINADGWLDIYVCNSGDVKGDSRENELFINNKNGTFTEKAKQYNLADSGLTTHAAFFDYDGDGDLDCYILNNSYRPIESFGYNRNLRNIRDAKGGDKLMRNDGNVFKDVSEEAGIYGSEIGFGLGVTVGDVNGDKWMDIYVSNDFFERDYLYINQRNGKFKEVLDTAMTHISLSSMGADMADINNDGLQDIFSTDMLPETDFRLKTTTKFEDYDVFNAKLKNDFHHQYTRNMLQLNNGDGTFSEIGQYAGVYATDWSWGALMFDMNNDGWKDIYVCNGIQKDLTEQDFLDFFSSDEIKQQIMQGKIADNKFLLDKMQTTKIANYAFINQQNLQFKNEAKNLGLDEESLSNGAAYADLDNDGDLDIVVNNENMQAFVYENNNEKISKNNYLKIALTGDTLNTKAIGAEVTIFYGKQKQMLQQIPYRGFESSVDNMLFFGLDKNTKVDSIKIIWPNRKVTTLQNIEVNHTVYVNQKDAIQNFVQQFTLPYWYSNASNLLQGDVVHKENVYTDFDAEKLMPQLISLEGPKMAKGDLNNDGQEDVVIGGAKGDGLKILVQKSNGQFIASQPQDIVEGKNMYEDVGICLADINGDKNLDIIVANGGNEINNDPTFDAFTPRVYINDGKANFKRIAVFANAVANNTSCIVANDIDKDGDIDLFIGGRSIAGSFGKTPKSYLMLNDGKGKFTSTTNSSLDNIGMVTDAVFVNLDNDPAEELCFVGQFMPLQIFKWKNNQLQLIKTIDNSNGWWNCIKTADFNNDGKQDLIAGNLGLNSKLQASVEKPVQLYVNDFDKNGQSESILTYYKSDGKSYPIHLKGELVSQIPSLKKKFLYYKDYAGKGIEDVFSKELLSKTQILNAMQLQTCLFINNGNYTFTTTPLPVQAQLSKVYSIVVNDFNNDGKQDVFVTGNFSGVKPEIGAYDGNYGDLFLNQGNANFLFVPPSTSGLYLRGEARDGIIVTNSKKEKLMFISINNEKLYLYKLK
jgi:enediyne biosynthesis protein E4